MPFQKQIIFRAAGALSQGATIIIKEYLRTMGKIQGQKLICQDNTDNSRLSWTLMNPDRSYLEHNNVH